MSAIEVSSWPRQKWHWSIISGTAYIYSNLLIYSNIANDWLNRSRNLTMIELKALKTWFWCINIQSWIMWYNFTLHNRWSGIVALHCSRKVGFVKRVGSFNAMQETAKSKNPTKKGKGQRETVFQMQYNYELCNRCTRRKSSSLKKSAKSPVPVHCVRGGIFKWGGWRDLHSSGGNLVRLSPLQVPEQKKSYEK